MRIQAAVCLGNLSRECWSLAVSSSSSSSSSSSASPPGEDGFAVVDLVLSLLHMCFDAVIGMDRRRLHVCNLLL